MPSAAAKKSQQEKKRQRAETAALVTAAGAGTLVATGASGAAVLDAAEKGGEVASKTTAAIAIAGAAGGAVEIAALMAGLVAGRGGMRWLADLVKPDERMESEDIQVALQVEAEREQAFIDKMRARLERDVPEALKQPDADAAVEAILDREQRYLEAHEDAAAARVAAYARRHQVKRLSPEGAYWVLSPLVKKHTPDAVAPGVVVAADGIEATATRWFEGELIEIQVESGASVTVSPNHPMLTTEGWVAARLLNEGHHLVRHLDGRFGDAGKNNLDHIPTRIEQRHRALASDRSLPRFRIPIRPQDFHGDGGYGYVDVVGTDRSLRNRMQTAFREQMFELGLLIRSQDARKLMGQGRTAPSLNAVLTVPGNPPQVDPAGKQPRGQAGASDAESFGQGQDGLAFAVGVDEVGGQGSGIVTASPDPDALRDKKALDGRPGDAELARKLLHGDSISVAPDRIIGIRWVPYAGQVYDLQTRDRWYTANSLIVHNCVAMAAVGWWPWEVLDALNPPTHVGCLCDLLTFEEAVGMGYLPSGDPPVTHDAVARAEQIMNLLAHDGHDHLREGADQDYSDSAMVALYPTPELAVDLALPGGDPPEQLHMTLGYLGKLDELGSLDAAIDAVRGWARTCPPLVGEISGYGTFVAGPEPVTYASVDLPDLPTARQELVDTLETCGSPAKCDHGYTPHITLDYAARRPKIEAQPVSFGHVHLVWGEDHYVFKLGGDLQEARELLELRWNRRYSKGTVFGGRFMPARGGFSPRLSIKDVLRKIMGNDAPDLKGRGQQRTITAPDPRDTLRKAGHVAGKAGETTKDAARGSEKAADAPKKGKKGKAAGKAKERVDGSLRAVWDRTVASQQALAKKHGVEFDQLHPASRDGMNLPHGITLPSAGGERIPLPDGSSLILIGEQERAALDAAEEIKAGGGELYDEIAAHAYNARRMMRHELIHSTSAITMDEYGRDDGFAIEEALTEELAHLATVDDLKDEGDLDVLMWLRRNPDHPRAKGVYRLQREGLLKVLDSGQVPQEDRRELLENLSMMSKTDDRIDHLASLVADAQGIDQERAVDMVRGAMYVHGDRSQVDFSVEGKTVLAPDLSDVIPEEEDLGYKPGDLVHVGGRGDEGYSGRVLGAEIGEDGRVYVAVDVPVKDADGKKIDSVTRWPDPDDVTKGGSRPKTIKSAKITGRIKEGDTLRIRRNSGEIELAKLEKVYHASPNHFVAEISRPDGTRSRLNDSQVKDVRRATEFSKASKPEKSAKPKAKKPKLEGGSRKRKAKHVSGPRGYDPRRYKDSRRALLTKVQALPPGEELELADGSRVIRGEKHGSALIERPDGSTRRYATPARLANAEIEGIEKRVGPREHLTNPADGDPDEHGTLANQQMKDLALDELTKGMESPDGVDDDDPAYWDDLGNLLLTWGEDPRAAMDRATERQHRVFQHAVKNNEPGEGPFFRGQAVEHAEPIQSGRVRGWSKSLQVAIDFALSGAEMRRQDGSRQRVGGTDVDKLADGDVLMMSLYEVEQSDRGLHIGEMLEKAETTSLDAARDEVERLVEDRLPGKLLDAGRAYVRRELLRDFDEADWQATQDLIPGREHFDSPQEAFEAHLEATDDPDDIDALIVEIDSLTGRDTSGDWVMRRGDVESGVREDAEIDAYEQRFGFYNQYEDEEEVILDNEALEGYRRVNVILAVGGRDNDMSVEAIKTKVEEALETGGYRFEDHEAAPGQMTFDDLNLPEYHRADTDSAKQAMVASGMASPDDGSFFSLRDGEGPLEALLRRGTDAIGIDPYDVDLEKLEAHAVHHERDPVSRFSIAGKGASPCAQARGVDYAVHVLLPEMMREKFPEMAEKLRATSPRWGRKSHEGEPPDFSDHVDESPPTFIEGMRSPEGMASPPPSLFDWMKWNKKKAKPRSAEQVERSMLEKPPEPVQGIPDYGEVELFDVKAAGGSNGARIAEDKDGLRWLQKTYRGDRDRVATELLSNAIYRELGVKVSNAGTGIVDHPEHGETLALVYPLVDGELRHWDEPNADLGEGFVADALLANWDVVGLDMDNVLWNGDEPIRLDQGGTLEFRAMGATKDFGPVPAELWTLNQGSGQANGRMEITDASLQAGAADAAIRLAPERIDELVNEAPFADEAMRERVRTALKQRVAWLDRFSRGEEELPRPREGTQEVGSYFDDRDSELEALPSEEAALESYLTGPLHEEVDDHLQRNIPKEEASDEVRDAVEQIDVLLDLDETRLDEEVVAYVPLPEGVEPSQIDGKWFTERSFLSLRTEKPEGESIRVTLPAGMNAVHPSSLNSDFDGGTVLVGRNTRLKVAAKEGQQVTAVAQQAPPKWGGMKSPEGPQTPAQRHEWLQGQVEQTMEQYGRQAEKTVDDIGKRLLTEPIDTDRFYRQADTPQTFTPERRELHAQQVGFILSTSTPQEEPVAVFMSGGSAAGKGTLLDSGTLDIPEDVARIDADEFKELIPEYQVAKAGPAAEHAAPMVHEESSGLSKEAGKIAIQTKRNVVVDAVGGSDSYFARIAAARDAGHTVEVNLVAGDGPDVAYEGAAERAKTTGRSVPVATIYGSHRQVARTFDDSWQREDEDGNPIGDPQEPLTALGVPITIWGADEEVIARVDENGILHVLDQEAYDRWRQVAKRPHPAKDPSVKAKLPSSTPK